jgi:threonyl-tRNA synthetase
MGSHERFIGFLIEHYAGAFPLWLSPVQLIILPVSDKLLNFSQKVKQILQEQHLRVELNDDNKTLGAKIREATLQKISYMIIIGNKELESFKVNKTYKVSIRTREGKDLGLVNLYEFIKDLKEKIENKL